MISEHISDDIPPQMKNLIWLSPFECPSAVLKFERWKPQKAARHPTICDVINDVKQLPTVCCRIYSHKYLSLSNQTSHYKIKGIRI